MAGRFSIVMAWVLIALPIRAQNLDADKARCYSTDAGAKVAGCTAMIDAKVTGADLAMAYNNRGVAYMAQGLADPALDDLTHAVTVAPGYANAWYNRGRVYEGLYLRNRAIADFNKAVELRPNYAEAFYERGSTLLGDLRYDEAIADFTKVIALQPDNTDAWAKRGLSYYDKGLRDKSLREEATADFRAALKLDPKNKAALTGLVLVDALPPGGAREVAAGLQGTRWNGASGCPIDDIQFIEDSRARVELKRVIGSGTPGEIGYTGWELAGDQIRFSFGNWDAELIGTVVSAERIDIAFDWRTVDPILRSPVPHSAKCKLDKAM